MPRFANRWHKIVSSGVMEDKNYTGTIPAQNRGYAITAESVVELPDLNQANTLYLAAKDRLLDVNNWQNLAGELSANFQLTDHQGVKITGPVSNGCYFKVDVPGIGPESGQGFDWVIVEDIEEYVTDYIESIGIRVRPAPNPIDGKNEISHFYSRESTSTFTLTREGLKITAAIYDRNTKANKDSDTIFDKVRNFLIGLSGKLAGSKIQWQKLTDGLIRQ